VFDSSNSISIWNNQGVELFNSQTIDKKREIDEVVFSPDNEKVAFVYADGVIEIFATTGKLIRTLKGYVYPDSVTAKFSPDGELLVFSGRTNVLHFWNSSNDSFESKINHNSPIVDFEFKPDDNILYSGDGENIKVWELENYSVIKQFEDNDRHSRFSIDQSSNTLVSYANSRVNLWKIHSNTATKRVEHELVGVLKNASNLQFSSDGKFIFFIKKGTSVDMFSLSTKETTNLLDYDIPITNINLTNDEKYLLALSSTGGFLNSQISENDSIVINKWYIENAHRSNKESSSEKYSTLKVWDLERQEEKPSIEATDVIVSRANDRIITIAPSQSSVNMSVRHIDGETLNSYDFSQRDVVYFNPYRESILLTSHNKHYLRLEGVNNDNQQIGQHSGAINDVAIHPKEGIIASASDDKTVKLWNFDGDFIKSLEGSKAGLKKLIFSPKGGLIAAANDSQEVFIWDLQGKLIDKSEGYEEAIRSLVFSPDGEKLAIADGQSLRLLNFSFKEGKTKGEEREVEIFPQPVSNVIFSKDGKSLAALSESDGAKVWDLNGTLIRSYSNFFGSRLRFSTDNKLLLLDSSIQSAGGIFSKEDVWRFWRMRNLNFNKSNQSIIGFSGDDLTSVDLDLDSLLPKACTLAKGFLVNNPSIKEQDRLLCDGMLEEEELATEE
ncbi:MAG: hypothetical protein AAGE59_21945, partial [Cyanobacteria bacterium P01_F01_bin.86]